MDRWVACVYGVDCETHRQALEEIQRLRDELVACLDASDPDELAEVIAARDDLQTKLDAIRDLAA